MRHPISTMSEELPRRKRGPRKGQDHHQADKTGTTDLWECCALGDLFYTFYERAEIECSNIWVAH